jgi:hypothetical protein
MRGCRKFPVWSLGKNLYRRICQTILRCFPFKGQVLSVMETVKESFAGLILPGIDYRNYIRTYLRNRRTLLLSLKENAISSKEKGREYRYGGIGANQLVVVNCVNLRLRKLCHSEGADGFEVILPSTCISNVTMRVCLPVNLKWLCEFEEPYDGRLSRIPSSRDERLRGEIPFCLPGFF